MPAISDGSLNVGQAWKTCCSIQYMNEIIQRWTGVTLPAYSFVGPSHVNAQSHLTQTCQPGLMLMQENRKPQRL